MSNYNLKARNKATGEIVEFTAIENYDYKKVGTNNVLDNRVFKMQYEVITDTQEDKGWREQLQDLPRRTINGCWYVELGSCESLFKDVEQQAYARGQAEAYERCADTARLRVNNNLIGENLPFENSPEIYGNRRVEAYRKGNNEASEMIAKAIEQLASNKE